MVRQNQRHERINFYISTEKIYKNLRGYNHAFKSKMFDPKTVIKSSRTTFFHTFGDMPISLTF